MKKRIEEFNEKIKNCTNCRLSETRKHVLCGEGNLDANIMLVAQAPGIKEDEEGIMFIGPSGKVLDELLKLSNVDRDDIYMTNLVKCMLPKYRDPKQDEIDACSIHLEEEIELINPSFLVPLGHFATKYLLEKYNIDTPIKKDFYKLYGKIILTNDYKILPLQHPAAVVYNPDLKKVLLNNYHKLQVISKKCKWYEACPMKTYYEEGLLDKKWIELYCKGDWESCVRYYMEENGRPHADYMLPDGTLNKKLEHYNKLC
jgi:uracil-DNA glycosylase